MFLSACGRFEAASILRDLEGTGLNGLIDQARTPGYCVKCLVGCLILKKRLLIFRCTSVPVTPELGLYFCHL